MVLTTLALGFSPIIMPHIQSCHKRSTVLVAALGRRQALSTTLGLGFVLASPPSAFASLDPNDMGRFNKALEGVNYLLDNWEKETQECTSSGNGVCNDSPDKVRYYFGLRTTDHPLFQLDKLYAKAQNKLPDDVDFEAWIDATEGLASQIAKINELAYTCVLPHRLLHSSPSTCFPSCCKLTHPPSACPAHLLASTIQAGARSRFESIFCFARNKWSCPRALWRPLSSC